MIPESLHPRGADRLQGRTSPRRTHAILKVGSSRPSATRAERSWWWHGPPSRACRNLESPISSGCSMRSKSCSGFGLRRVATGWSRSGRSILREAKMPCNPTATDKIYRLTVEQSPPRSDAAPTFRCRVEKAEMRRAVERAREFVVFAGSTAVSRASGTRCLLRSGVLRQPCKRVVTVPTPTLTCCASHRTSASAVRLQPRH